MDSDVVFIANVQEVTMHAVPHVIFQWGASKCAGFVLLNMQRMGEFWGKLKIAIAKLSAENDDKTQHVRDHEMMRHGDQSMLKVVHEYFPDEVGPLPDAWDLSMANQLWKVASHLVEKRPRAGMLHFNGGGGSKESYFSKGITSDGFRTVNYYVQLPWSWVHFLGESRCAATQSCRPLKLSAIYRQSVDKPIMKIGVEHGNQSQPIGACPTVFGFGHQKSGTTTILASLGSMANLQFRNDIVAMWNGKPMNQDSIKRALKGPPLQI